MQMGQPSLIQSDINLNLQQIFGWQADQEASVAASHLLAQSTNNYLPVSSPANVPTNTISSSDAVPFTSMGSTSYVSRQSSSQPPTKKKEHIYL